mgnify:CR=1 FL=1
MTDHPHLGRGRKPSDLARLHADGRAGNPSRSSSRFRGHRRPRQSLGQFGSDVAAWVPWRFGPAAAMMHRAGAPGPAEAVLRRLVYEKR